MALLIGFRFGPSRSLDSGVGEDEDRGLDWAWTEVSVCGSLKGRMIKSTDLNKRGVGGVIGLDSIEIDSVDTQTTGGRILM